MPDSPGDFHPLTEPVGRFLSRLIELSPHSDDVLAEMEEVARQTRFPIVGPVVGHFLMQVARLLRPRRVLELGSGFGYSAYWLARGMEKGEILLTDYDTDHLHRARYYLERGGFSVTFSFLRGDGVEILESQPDGSLDLVFLDHEKTRYPEAATLARTRLRVGGVLLADNVFLGGRLFEEDGDERVQAMQRFVSDLFSDAHWLATIVPVRDGVLMAIRMGSEV